ncbi:hypothetical protein, partial [Levilactobacillus spicheri]
SPRPGEFPELGLIVSQQRTPANNHFTTGENADATLRGGGWPDQRRALGVTDDLAPIVHGGSG